MDRKVYKVLSRLLRYPGEGYKQESGRWIAEVRETCPAAGDALARFQDFLADSTPEALEEKFCRTFDNSQSAALEIGWHLHGESYDRGAHLVRMRELLREHDLDEGGELPDHLSNVLQVMAACDADLSRRLAEEMVEPSVKKICISLASGQNPYETVLDAVLEVINLHVQETLAV
ncbi:MAG: nitrate reductase molybdenum cofactor assembly chaperone [Planctomycetota bacterium]